MNITSSFLSRFFFLFPIVCLLLISVPPLPCALLHAEDLVPLDEALPVLESFERRIIRVQWDAEMSSHTCPDLTDRENATLVPLGKGDQGDKCFYRWSVVFEPASGRYRLNQQTANNWVAGAAPYSSSFDEYSYDGKTEREFHWSAHGLELPTTDRKDSAKTGMVDKEQKRRMMERWGISTSIGEFPPYCRTELLSEFLRSQSQARKSVRITKNGSSVWHIQTSDPAPQGKKYNAQLSIDFDVARGCVTQTEIWSPKAKTPDFRIYFDLAEAKPGLWLPWRKDIVNLFTKNILRTIFENVKVNEPLEDESIFHVRFQPGTTVEDRVEKIVYRVGKGSSEERRDIRKFTAEQELALAKEAAEKPSSLWWPWLAGGLGLTLCVGLACYWWRYRGRAKVAGLLIGRNCQRGHIA